MVLEGFGQSNSSFLTLVRTKCNNYPFQVCVIDQIHMTGKHDQIEETQLKTILCYRKTYLLIDPKRIWVTYF